MKVTLHIGTEKTGSTSIQRALAADRSALAANGILFPVLFGSANHMEVAVAAMDSNSKDELQIMELSREACSHDEYRELIRQRIADEISAGDYNHLVISNEHCHSRIRNAEELQRLLYVLGVDAKDCEVIVYLRRQDRLAVSLYSTVLKLGGNSKVFPDFANGQIPHYFNFRKILDLYASVFGAERIQARLFERQYFENGDVVTDFYKTAGLGIAPSRTLELNVSVSLAQSLFLRRFNVEFPIVQDGKMNAERGPIYDAISKVGRAEKFKPQRLEALKFFEAFTHGNQIVRQRFMPTLERTSLFDLDFSEYPETKQRDSLTEEELFAFTFAIWRHKRQI